MKINLDVDGVLCDFVGGALRVMKGMGYNFEHQDVQEWAIENLLPEEQRPEFLRRCTLKGFCAGLALFPQARDFVFDLLSYGHSVTFLTSPWEGSDHWIPERRAWLFEHFGSLPVSFAQGKAGYTGDLLIDDRTDHVKAWRRTGRAALLVDQPYNRSELDSCRVKSFGEILHIVGGR